LLKIRRTGKKTSQEIGHRRLRMSGKVYKYELENSLEEALILAINPGSTSTKVSIFRNSKCIFSRSLQHSSEELKEFSSIADQYEFRRNSVTDFLDEIGVAVEELACVVGRGGLIRPLKGGTYAINQKMLDDVKSGIYGEHASNLGAIIAFEIAAISNIPSFVVDPVVVDEMEPLARLSGLPHIERKSVFHALNQKAVGKKAALEIGKNYDQVNLIIAHLGGGITIGAHKHGKVVDVNNGLEEGPFSPERSGSLPVHQLIDMCFSGEYTKNEMKKLVVGDGGINAYLGTSNCHEIETRAEKGDMACQMILEGMAYQIAKEIGACSAVLKGDVDLVVLTGGLARSKMLINWITDRIMYISPVVVYPGEDEMQALADGALRVLKGIENAIDY